MVKHDPEKSFSRANFLKSMYIWLKCNVRELKIKFKTSSIEVPDFQSLIFLFRQSQYINAGFLSQT